MSQSTKWYSVDLKAMAVLYRLYIQAFSRFAKRRSPHTSEAHADRYRHFEQQEVRAFADLDAEATELGNQYRGLGVSVGLLGALIIFLAVAPTGLRLGGPVMVVFGAAKLAAMVTMFLLIWHHAFRSKLRTRWIIARRRAELQRYQTLRASMDQLRKIPPAADAALNLRNELARILDDQVKYNSGKAATYATIEWCSDRAGWAGFLIAVLAAFWLFLADLEIVRDQPWLIFLTTALPALVGAIHGINGFLQVGTLADQHLAMSRHLGELSVRLRKTEGGGNEKLQEVAEEAYRHLTDRDTQWVDTARKLGLKPV